jgi:hypothetical protein
VDPDTGYTIMEVSVEISKADLEAAGGQEYKCECRAFYKEAGSAPGEFQYIVTEPTIIIEAC